VEHLLTSEELAEYCKISYQYLRYCFAKGVLPEPENLTRFKNRTTRRFTMKEAANYRKIFSDTNPRKFADKKRRAKVRKQIRRR
jgi:hypothetical protein